MPEKKIEKMNVLVTGGAGYIGSITVRRLMQSGIAKKVVVIDNLSKGHEEALPVKSEIPAGISFSFVKGDISDEEILERVLPETDAILHFAAFIEVGESEKNPLKYFKNNLQNSTILLNKAVQHGVKFFVYSSSAAVYGAPSEIPIPEDAAREPTNVYGLTKLLFERLLQEYTYHFPLSVAALRYFNAAGADLSNPEHALGEMHEPESHLIPLVLQTALGKRDSIKIFGTDYETKDGTCVRDFVHVTDLAEAHVLSLRFLAGHGNNKPEQTHWKKGFFTALNLGGGKGYSVREVISACKDITQANFKVEEEERRKGDPPVLLASIKKAETLIGWRPKHSLKDIIKDAWEWHKIVN